MLNINYKVAEKFSNFFFLAIYGIIYCIGEFMAKIYDFKNNIDNKKLEEIAYALKNDKLIVFPTETVYGIGANALSYNAVNKIFMAKGRPTDNPLIVHVNSKQMINSIAKTINEIEKKLIDIFMPGPITIILKKKNCIPDNVTCSLDTVGVRMPENIIARKIIEKSGLPIAAPSANISGKPSGTNIDDIKNELKEKVDYIIDGGMCEIGLESTVVKVENDFVKILRPGKISTDDFAKHGFKVKLDSHIFNSVKDGEKVESPGMKHRHYAPNAKAVLVCSNDNTKKIAKIKEIINENKIKYNNIFVMGFEEHKKYFENINYISFGTINNINSVSKNIFKCLRILDKKECDFCIIEGVESKGVGVAIINRLLRACEYNIIEI